MDDKTIHLNYLHEKGRFHLDCNKNIFSKEELDVLEEFGHWFQALTDGTLKPFNEEQKNFIEVARFNKEAKTDFEKLWFKYLKRKEIELKAGNTLNQTPQLEDNSFYSRDMAKALRKTMFKVMKETHKK